jgi:hypothetical protein
VEKREVRNRKEEREVRNKNKEKRREFVIIKWIYARRRIL